MVNPQVPESRRSGFESQLCHLLFVWPLKVFDNNAQGFCHTLPFHTPSSHSTLHGNRFHLSGHKIGHSWCLSPLATVIGSGMDTWSNLGQLEFFAEIFFVSELEGKNLFFLWWSYKDVIPQMSTAIVSVLWEQRMKIFLLCYLNNKKSICMLYVLILYVCILYVHYICMYYIVQIQ